MEIEDFLKLRLSKKGVKDLLTLPPPEKSIVQTAKANQLFGLCKCFYKLWSDLLVNKDTIPISRLEIITEERDEPLILEDEELFDAIFLFIAGYYDFALHRYISAEPKNKKELPPGISLVAISKLMPNSVDENGYKYAALRFFSAQYFICLYSLYVLDSLRYALDRTGPLGEIEKIFHRELEYLFEYKERLTGPYLNTLGRRVIRSILEYATRIYTDMQVWDKEHQLGPFSAIRLQELSLLSKRDPLVIGRYGERYIAKIFERQLALIALSFGMFVVSTRSGTQTVDLLCISSRPDERYTFLIEAKTTKAAYALPKKDSRALRDYIIDVRDSLTTLPPLAFVLIVGPNPSRTISKKIADLENKAGIPIRYCKTKILAALRERLMGPLPLKIFMSEILQCPKVLPESIVDSIANTVNLQQSAHKTFTETMLSTHGIIKVPSDWIEI
jgi:hypothetical protein